MADRLWARLGVKGALLRNGRLLLLRRRPDLDLWPGLWDLPGGGVAPNETLEEALVREVREETGFNVRVGRVLDVSFQWVQVRAEPQFPSVVPCYRCSTASRATPRLDPSEHTEFAWVTKQELRDLAAVPRLRNAMRTALRAEGSREGSR